MMPDHQKFSGICPYKTKIKGSANAMKQALSMCFSLWPVMVQWEPKVKNQPFKTIFFLKTQWFYGGLNVLDSVALITKQFSAYFVQKFKYKDKLGCKGFINGWKI